MTTVITKPYIDHRGHVCTGDTCSWCGIAEHYAGIRNGTVHPEGATAAPTRSGGFES